MAELLFKEDVFGEMRQIDHGAEGKIFSLNSNRERVYKQFHEEVRGNKAQIANKRNKIVAVKDLALSAIVPIHDLYYEKVISPDNFHGYTMKKIGGGTYGI